MDKDNLPYWKVITEEEYRWISKQLKKSSKKRTKEKTGSYPVQGAEKPTERITKQ